MLMAETLRAVFPKDDGWLKHLKQPRRDALEERWSKLQGGEMELDKLLAAEFCDKKEAMVNSVQPLPCGKGKAAKQIERIEDLRNAIAHAGEYAATHQAAFHCAETVRLTQSWIGYLSEWLLARAREPSR